MSEYVAETIEHKGVTIKIIGDPDPDSPREWDNVGKMVYWHRRYNLGDENGEKTYGTPEDFRKEMPKGTIMLPLFLYDHSGLTMSTAPFSCPWDSGQVGYIYATPEMIREALSCKRITKKVREQVTEYLEGEVETYDQFLRGDVYGYVIEDENGDDMDSCWGFYGFDYCKQEALRAAQSQAERVNEQKGAQDRG